MSGQALGQRTPWKKIYALPAEHGSWIWWIGPLVLGTAAAGRLTVDLIPLTAALFSAFLLRQPISLLVKIMSGRRPKSDLPPVKLWLCLYGFLLAIAGFVLIGRGFERLLLLLIPGAPVFGWHLWLVSKREERGQRGIEIFGAGVLALAAPAAYWICDGNSPYLPWILWLLAWLQSTASIVLVYLRLDQRDWQSEMTVRGNLRAGGRALRYHLANTLIAVGLVVINILPWGIALAFILVLIDALVGILQPATGQRPTRIGLRQLLSSTSFYLLASLAFIV